MRYLGIDWSRKTSTFDVSDAKGKRLKKGELDNSEESFRRLVRDWKDNEGIRVLIEVGGRVFKWARAMEAEGADVYVLETHQNALIRESTRKTDRRDALQLREQRRLGMVPPDRVPIPEEEEEQLRLLLNARSKAVSRRTAISNQAIRHADSYGLYLYRSACTTDKGWKIIFGHACEWDVAQQLLLKHLYDQFKLIQEQILVLEEELERRCCATPAMAKKVGLLRSIPGVGRVTTWTILARVGDVRRFANSRKLVRYAGLAPSQRQSGNFRGGGRLTKSGNALLRAYLTQAALGIIQSKRANNPLRIWYEQVKKRRGWKKARVALARKILTVAYGVLKHERAFDPRLLEPKELAAA
jgi:transposase